MPGLVTIFNIKLYVRTQLSFPRIDFGVLASEVKESVHRQNYWTPRAFIGAQSISRAWRTNTDESCFWKEETDITETGVDKSLSLFNFAYFIVREFHVVSVIRHVDHQISKILNHTFHHVQTGDDDKTLSRLALPMDDSHPAAFR